MSAHPLHAIACAQAAAAALLARAQAGPYAAGATPSEHDAIAALLRTHPPDVPFGLGTSAFRLAALLRAHGFVVRGVHGGRGARHARQRLAEVAASAARGWPVPVCIDNGLLGGRAFEAHWALVTRVTAHDVHLWNAREPVLPIARFMKIWACRALPWTHNACALLVQRSLGEGGPQA